jgi:phage baseplate assembly protein gpV
MNDIVRIGKVSTINYDAGTASVIYTDKNNEASPQYPLFSSAYEMPNVDDTVVVIMLPNSTSKGFIVGVPFSGKKIPDKSGKGIFYKEFSDGTSIYYNPSSKTLAIDVDKVTLESLTVSGALTAGSIEADTIEAQELNAETLEAQTLNAQTLNADSASISNLSVSGTATINNLVVTGSASGHFPE